MIPVEDYPSCLFLPILPEPPFFAALKGQIHTSFHDQIFVADFGSDFAKLRLKYGIKEAAAVSLEMLIFYRAIAKIAHAWAVGTRDSFTPILSDILRDPDLSSRAILPFVGCGPPEDAAQLLYELDNLFTVVGNDTYYVTSVRLFPLLGAPTYYVVVGTPNGQVLPALPNNPGGVDAVQVACRVRHRDP